MNPKSRWAIAFAGAMLLFGSAMAQASQSAKHEAEELRRVKLSLIEAVIAAEKESGGKATSADGKKLTRYDLDPRTSNVQKTPMKSWRNW
jgi:hypothetical protein